MCMCLQNLLWGISFCFFVMPCRLWDLSSLTRDWAQALGRESMESQTLDHQGSSRENPFSSCRALFWKLCQLLTYQMRLCSAMSLFPFKYHPLTVLHGFESLTPSWSFFFTCPTHLYLLLSHLYLSTQFWVWPDGLQWDRHTGTLGFSWKEECGTGEGHIGHDQSLLPHSQCTNLFILFLQILLMWTIFKVFIEFVIILLLLLLFFSGWETGGILAPRTGIKPSPLPWKVKS